MPYPFLVLFVVLCLFTIAMYPFMVLMSVLKVMAVKSLKVVFIVVVQRFRLFRDIFL